MVLSVMDPWVLFPERGYLGFLSVLNFYFYLLNLMRRLSRNAGYFVGGWGCVHSGVSFWTERWPCFRNYEFAPWLYFLTMYRDLTVLKLAKICSRTIVTTETMRTSFFFSFTKTIRILKLLYGKIIDFRFGTVLKYIVLCVVILRCKQRLCEHCIIFITAGTGSLSYPPPEYYRWKIFRQPCWLFNIHELGARGRMFPADDGGDLSYFYSLEHFAHLV
jgi:hypothetical protein